MKKTRYLIVGGGMAADAAVQGIQDVHSSGETIVISKEQHPPYDRPPLSKGLWKKEDEKDIWRDAAKEHAELVLGREVVSIDRTQKIVEDNQGDKYEYEKLLLATGGAPKTLPFDAEGLVYFRTFDDYQLLRNLPEDHKRVAVIGGGFIGSEIAAALATAGREVAMVFPEVGIGGRIFPPGHAEFLNDYYRQKGVIVNANAEVTAISSEGNSCVIDMGHGPRLEADVVVAGVGLQPNMRLAESTGLEVEDGVVVDKHLRTSDPDIYAAGDVANFFNPALGKRMRVEHEDNANNMGKLAGRNMAGEDGEYTHLPMFYSDLFELGYEAIGETRADLEIVAEWIEPHKKGVLLYLGEGGRVRGLVFWNVWDAVEKGRKLIAREDAADKDSLREWARSLA